MKTSTKILAALIALILVVGVFAACGKKGNNDQPETVNEVSDTAAQTDEETAAPAEEPETAAPADETKAAAPSGGAGSSEITLFADDSQKATVGYVLPASGWSADDSSNKLYLYNVSDVKDAYSDTARIQFELTESEEKINFYKDKFTNYNDVDNRTIGGIDMVGRTYTYVGMEWTEYYGKLGENWVTVKISGVDVADGTEGAAILDSITLA